MIYWDQRGAGKSFYPDIPRSSMTVEQFISDLDELVDTVCRRLGHSKVSMTLEVYAHVTGNMQADAAGVLGRLLHG